MSISAPKTDELIARHQFYAEVAVKLSQDEIASQTRARLHQRVDEVTTLAHDSKDRLNTFSTQKKTVVGMMMGIWVVLGGAVTWGFDKTITKMDSYITQIETQKKKIEEMERVQTMLVEKSSQIENNKMLTKSLQTDLDALRDRISAHDAADKAGPRSK